MPGPVVYISIEERWKATKIKDNSRCYCELYHCKPFCKIPTGKPKKCELSKQQCFIVWIVILAAILTPVIWALATQTNYCGRQGMVDCGENTRKCILKNQVCDGVKDCNTWTDENACKSKFKQPPDYAVCLLNERCIIPRKAVLSADKTIRWSYTNLAGAGELLDVGRETGVGNDEYGIKTSRKDNGYDLQIYRFVEGHADQTYVSSIQPEGQSRSTLVIAADEWTCNPGPAGTTVRIGDSVTLTASVRYYGNTEPEIYWYDPDDNRLNVETRITEHTSYTTLTVTHSFTIAVSHQGEYKAYLFRSLPTRHTSSPPDTYATFCSTYINVLYGTDEVSIDYDLKKTYNVNSRITCKGNGNPEPSFYWHCAEVTDNYRMLEPSIFQYGSVLVVPGTDWPTLSCTCTGSNRINGTAYTSFHTELISIGSGSGRPIHTVWITMIVVSLLMYLH